jgi:hypothetical protein
VGSASQKLAKLLGTYLPKFSILPRKKGVACRNPQITEDLEKDPYCLFIFIINRCSYVGKGYACNY